MKRLTQTLVERKLSTQNEGLITNEVTGQTFERSYLRLGPTILSREVMRDGARGDVTIKTMEQDGFLGATVGQKDYALVDGRIVRNPSYYPGTERPRFLSRVMLVAKIAFS